MFEGFYKPDARDREIFGDIYNPPAEFVHGQYHQIAELSCGDGDGQNVTIYESRLPARFFKVEAHARPDYAYANKPAFALTTGSGEEMGRLTLSIAKAIAEGMLGIELPEASNA